MSEHIKFKDVLGLPGNNSWLDTLTDILKSLVLGNWRQTSASRLNIEILDLLKFALINLVQLSHHLVCLSVVSSLA